MMLRAALALADEHGIDALSMRELGRHLGVDAMSLYNHVANKDDLLDGIVDIYLPDMKYMHADKAARYSAGACLIRSL